MEILSFWNFGWLFLLYFCKESWTRIMNASSVWNILWWILVAPALAHKAKNRTILMGHTFFPYISSSVGTTTRSLGKPWHPPTERSPPPPLHTQPGSPSLCSGSVSKTALLAWPMSTLAAPTSLGLPPSVWHHDLRLCAPILAWDHHPPPWCLSPLQAAVTSSSWGDPGGVSKVREDLKHTHTHTHVYTLT